MTVSLRTLLPRIGICTCFALLTTWLRFTLPPTIFPAIYISRFVLFPALLITIGVWFACGMPGFTNLRRDRLRALMLLCLLLLASWAYASQSWGFAAAVQPAHGLNAVLSWCVVALFCVVVASAAPPPIWIAGTLIGMALFNAALATAQVANNGWLGWWRLGEFRFHAGIDGTSLIQSGDITFVRPYGLLAHPNMLGGLLVVGVILAASAFVSHETGSRLRRWLSHFVRPPMKWAGYRQPPAAQAESTMTRLSPRRGRFRLSRGISCPGDARRTPYPGTPFMASASPYLMLPIFAILLYALLLTFSRAAWIGLAGGGAAWLGMLWKRAVGAQSVAPLPMRLLPLIVVALAVGGLFFAQYRPLIGARVGDGAESLELRSVSDRLVYTDFALRAIAERPLIGQGAGYFPWRAAAYLEDTFFDLRGDHVHQVFLSVWAELGLVGFALMSLALCLGVEAALRTGARGGGGLRAAMLASAIALAIIGLFDHYPYSQLPFMALWWGLLAAAAGR